MKANKYPDYMMKIFRQRLGLEEDDTSNDDVFNTYTPREALEEWLNWEGIIGYTYSIINAVEDCYGIILEEN